MLYKIRLHFPTMHCIIKLYFDSSSQNNSLTESIQPLRFSDNQAIEFIFTVLNIYYNCKIQKTLSI